MDRRHDNTVCEHGSQRRKCPICELAEVEAKLARVTAERDDYRERWEQTGCTRHHAMETAIKLNESCRQQLDAAIQERDALREALRIIEAWSDFPRVMSGGQPVPYCIAYGSNGERDYMRQIARAALNGEGDHG